MRKKERRERIGTPLRSRFMLVEVGKYSSQKAVALGSVPELARKFKFRPYMALQATGYLGHSQLLNK
jgi:hypothetical protein